MNKITESRNARLSLLVDFDKKKVFEEICAAQDLTPSQVLRQLIREYIDEHSVDEQIVKLVRHN